MDWVGSVTSSVCTALCSDAGLVRLAAESLGVAVLCGDSFSGESELHVITNCFSLGELYVYRRKIHFYKYIPEISQLLIIIISPISRALPVFQHRTQKNTLSIIHWEWPGNKATKNHTALE